MNGTTKAAFTFETFRITQFSLVEHNEAEGGLNAQFDPHGLYQPNDGLFVMILNFTTFSGEEKTEIIKASLVAHFRFHDDPPTSLEELPAYFYGNAIAIVFPYLRAFITTLTAQANMKPIIMPVFNLSGLEPVFREQTSLGE